MKYDLNTLFSLPRMWKLAASGYNTVKGLYEIVRMFYKPHFKMVEVGSFEGVSTLLFSMFVNTVYSVDCYDYKVPPTGRIPEHDQLFVDAERMFIERTKDIPNIVKIKKTSVDAAKDFEDGSLDAVYIDAEHDEDSVRADIKAWRPKLKQGGVLSGHDFWLSHIPRLLIEEEGFIPKEITTAPDSSWAVIIPRIDLVAVACTKVSETIEAMRKCMSEMAFSRKILFTHEELNLPDIEVINIPQLDYVGYNEFVAMKLWQYTGAEYVLLVQNDGYIKRGDLWTNEFLKYDYIGAPWPIPPEHDMINYRTPQGELVRVGNGGFSLRSRKLLRAPTLLGLNFNEQWAGYPTEDGFLCVRHRDELLNHSIKFAPVDIAARFSTELKVPETVESFGGHRYL